VNRIRAGKTPAQVRQFAFTLPKGFLRNQLMDDECVDYGLELRAALGLAASALDAEVRSKLGLPYNARFDEKAVLVRLLGLTPGASIERINEALDRRQHGARVPNRTTSLGARAARTSLANRLAIKYRNDRLGLLRLPKSLRQKSLN
jgi:hypothetical protein